MKQYTNESQTAKLIELGLPKPRYYCTNKYTIIHTGFDIINYSIGELIEILPHVIVFGENDLFCPLRVMPTVGGGWAISYCKEYDERNNELIDALYDMIVKLKEDGVI